MNKRKADYAALKRKLFLRVLLLAGIAVIVVFAARSLSSGKVADKIVGMISTYLQVDKPTAAKIYVLRFRNFLGVAMALCCIAVFVLFFRNFLNTITRYFDEITDVVDALSKDTGTLIHLSPELGAAENKLKTLQQTIERNENQARQAEQRKNDLVIYSAHDIKTPLTSVLGYLILLNGNPNMPSEDRKKYTGIALDKTKELDGMINELFEITRYNLNEIELEKAWINLFDMLSEIKEEHFPQLQAAKKQAEITMAKDIRLFGDAEKLARVFNNLFRNAILYSDPETTVHIFAKNSDQGVEVDIENTCKPLSEAKLNRLFDQFYRAKDPTQPEVPGAGLGLAIAKEIVLLHGGTISAENTDTGIRFRVCLPVVSTENY